MKVREYVIERDADLRDADLRDADLQEVDLRVADLRRSDLRWADLRRSDLRGADLRRSDLRWADLRGADLREANLRGAIGAHILAHTQHGFTVLAVWHSDYWRIHAGCRDFTIYKAREHWGEAYEYQPDAERIGLMLDWLEKQPLPDTDPEGGA